MDLVVAATTFALIFPAELPDKTMVATLVLATRYRGLAVWCGVAAAFVVQCAVAVAAGGVISLLPRRPVLAATALLFAVGAFLLLRGGVDSHDMSGGDEDTPGGDADTPSGAEPGSVQRGGFRAVATSFGVLFAAEWGDLSQLLTAGLAARYRDPLSVFAGSWAALAVVAAIAVLAGRALTRRVRLATVRRIAGLLAAAIAVVTGLEAAGVHLLG